VTAELDDNRDLASLRAARGRAAPPAEQAPLLVRPEGAPLVTRLAAQPDSAVLGPMVRRATVASPGSRESPLAHSRLGDVLGEQILAGQVMLAERGAKLLGFAAIRARLDGNCEIDALFVERDRWRIAVATLLVGHCADRARALGACALYAAGAPRAERFHLDCGFTLTGLATTDAGTAQILRMSLVSA
jgi:GNAT superfamily N-acetyltransferase